MLCTKIEVRYLDDHYRWYVVPYDSDGNQVDFKDLDCVFTKCPHSHSKNYALDDAFKMAEGTNALIHIYTRNGNIMAVVDPKTLPCNTA
jgi:hypothetical protein|tara:strand:- start:40 stop:306 length:267 start_codon:yes stop_codon:yes gene_type:complete